MIRRFHVALFVLVLSLSGCADNCSLLSGNSSFGCNVMWGGALILTAPFILPAEAAKRAAKEAEEKEDYLRLKEGVKNGDLASLKRCVFRCRYFLVFMDEKHQLEDDAAKKLIALDGPALPQEHVEAMMVAYRSLAWEKISDSVWQLSNDHVQRGWAIAQRYLQTANSSSSYDKLPNELAQYVFSLYVQSLPAAQIQSAFEGCVAEDKLPKHPKQTHRREICEKTYTSHLRKQNPAEHFPKVPKELESRWVEDSRALERERRDASRP